ncbi:hypothetical protein KSD_50560 [Ktedonobacter sp. SOSP1-85]|uniref:P-type ATPase n=1 Tax=Ktedonobacter sp. SOSP1-85 TaxID=2778367 RepID=UPI0019153989|nr:hypothetical protein [Ktedonobacter sp. SOSP1-85]GHO77285.1 hypothetical protein KSD_50560 [Ktedonobacter sp. SOSP1-85]
MLVASLVSAILSDPVDASIIVVIVLLSNVLNFVQTSRSQNSVEKLRANVAPTTSVRRDGAWLELPRRVVAPGDIVRLAAGGLVPADACLVNATDRHVQQTGIYPFFSDKCVQSIVAHCMDRYSLPTQLALTYVR